MNRAPDFIRDLPAIDDTARDGRCRLVSDGTQFAVGIWRDNAWRFPGGSTIDFTPDRYQR